MEKAIFDEQNLFSILKKDILETSKNIKIFGGHLPLLYLEDNERHVELDTKRWGEFSVYSFDFATKLLKFVTDHRRNAKIVLVVDDDIELPKIEKDGRFVRRDKTWHKKPRRRLFRESILPLEYNKILSIYGLNTNYLVKQQISDTKSFLISEKKLKAEAVLSGQIADNECSLAYKGLIFSETYFKKEDDYLISFMPGQCKGSICGGFLNSSNIDSSHVFFPHIENMGSIFETRTGYKRIGDYENISQFYEKGLITYRKDINSM
ncbi:hypothetical protein ACFO3O_01745 [Dokdonia ponticola]|uniref:Uncharacterized protein n=1 Tax=Dokdonia ponticola TaxID=2041041 RepID=A0ABV9HR00_9FLAO